LLKEEEVSKVDGNRVYSVYEDWPRFARNVIEKEIYIDISKPSMLVLSGMGGSGTTSDIIYDILYDSNIPTYVIKGYHLPSFIDTNALVIAISSSGNTEETLSIFAEAYKKGLNIIGISSGGLLEKTCKNHNYEHIKVEEHIAPRYSLPEILFATLKVISSIESLESIKKQIDEAIKTMELIREKISIHNDDNIAKQLAWQLKDSMTVTYTSPYCKSIGTRFKNSLNENAKCLSITADIIEASHNEIVAWSREKNCKPILIKDPRDSEAIDRRFAMFGEILRSYNNEIYEFPLFADDTLANIIASIYVLDYTTIYLSVLRGIDPLPIEPIIRLKSTMKRFNYIDRLRSYGVDI
jgi:glucose/mannose-6-phosphate isomerase